MSFHGQAPSESDGPTPRRPECMPWRRARFAGTRADPGAGPPRAGRLPPCQWRRLSALDCPRGHRDSRGQGATSCCWRAGLRVAAAAVGIRDSPECQRRYINVAGTDRSQAGKGRVGLPAACGSLEAPIVRRWCGESAAIAGSRTPTLLTGDTRTCMRASR